MEESFGFMFRVHDSSNLYSNSTFPKLGSAAQYLRENLKKCFASPMLIYKLVTSGYVSINFKIFTKEEGQMKILRK